MKKGIHPEGYKLVAFRDMSNNTTFVTRSTVQSKEKVVLEDGKEYPLVKLEISNKRTVRKEGIVRRNSSEVLHDHVRNVEIRQSFLQRLTNVGYLGISSSGQDGIEIEVRDLPKPYELKSLIDAYRNL